MRSPNSYIYNMAPNATEHFSFIYNINIISIGNPLI